MDNNFTKVYGVKVFPIDYLMNNELSESDLESLFDEKSKSLIYSIIIGMFRHIHSKKRNSDIIKLIKNKKWMYRYQWSTKECQEYEDKLTKSIQNIYRYGPVKSLSIAQWYISIYGFKSIGSNIDL